MQAKRLTLIMALVLALTSSVAVASWGVYIHAHPDDWQTFQSPRTLWDYFAHGDNLLLILTTAGDAGKGVQWWQAREEASKESWRWGIGPGPEINGQLSILGHTLTYWQKERVIMVFMRLPNPDYGSITADCPPSTPSLCRLRDGALPGGLTAVDGSTTYVSWSDFYLTLKSIITTFAPNNSSTWINAPDPNRSRQTSDSSSFVPSWCSEAGPCLDHPDHLATADAMQQILPGMAWSRAFWIDYPICYGDSDYPVNFPAPNDGNYLNKKALFMAYNNKLRDLTCPGPLCFDEYASMPGFWENCFQRHHRRVE